MAISLEVNSQFLEALDLLEYRAPRQFRVSRDCSFDSVLRAGLHSLNWCTRTLPQLLLELLLPSGGP